MKQHRLTSKRHRLKPEDVRQLCHELSHVGDGECPVLATGWSTRGRWKRLEVVYPNGWRLSFRIDDAGNAFDITSSIKFTIGMQAQVAGNAADD